MGAGELRVRYITLIFMTHSVFLQTLECSPLLHSIAGLVEKMAFQFEMPPNTHTEESWKNYGRA